MNTTDQTIAKIHNALRLVKETEALLRETLAEVSKEPKIHFYEIYFEEKTAYGNEDQPSICIRGIRKPTLAEANEYYKLDCAYFGGPITEINEESKETVEGSYHILDGKPVFGKDPATVLATNHFPNYFVFGDKLIIVWATKSQGKKYAESCFKETYNANRCLLCKHREFIAAVHGGLEPIESN